MLADPRPERLVPPGDLRRRELDRPLRRLQPTRPAAITVATALLGAALVVIAPERIPRLGLQRLFQDQTRRQPHQL